MSSKLQTILSLSRRPERTAALARWAQSLYPDSRGRPVLVGGAALELFTGGAYITGDLDFVGTVPPSVEDALREADFELFGRHWIHAEERVSIVYQDKALEKGRKAVERYFEVYRVLVISPEDLLVDRLVSWRYCESPLHAVQAYLLYCGTHWWMDVGHLISRVVKDEVELELDSLLRLFFKNRGQVPDGDLLSAWASRGE
jgi:hypothetical protein